MASYSTNLGERIEKDFIKHGWKQIKQGEAVFYERPLSSQARERMVHAKKKTTIPTKRRRGTKVLKSVIRWLRHAGARAP